MREINAILTIATRDLVKLLGDRPRIIISLIFPLIFIGGFGKGLQSNLGQAVSFDLFTFIFIGILIQTFFSSTASGIISLIEDRENDFSQEIFVSPISRYSIIMGKILGETLVSSVQVVGILVFGYLLGVSASLPQILILIIVGFLASLLGGAFGTLVMANLTNQRLAAQFFPFIIFPQFFLAGVFNPIKNSPYVLDILSKLMPLTYPIDLARGLYYWGKPEYSQIVLFDPWFDFAVIMVMFIVMLFFGTYLFVRNERNR